MNHKGHKDHEEDREIFESSVHGVQQPDSEASPQIEQKTRGSMRGESSLGGRLAAAPKQLLRRFDKNVLQSSPFRP
jgi:hypothetical protein